MNRKKKIILNSFSSVCVNLATIGSSIIIPALIIQTYGSTVNGLLASITQFLSYISLLEGGVGGVVKAALYKPIAQKDNHKINSILKAALLFFNKLALVCIIYIGILAIVYPYFIKTGFATGFILTLIIILGIGTISQYFLGVPYLLLLQSEQLGYIADSINIICLVANTIITVFFINLGTTIHTIKIISAFLFCIKPILIYLYAKKINHINLNVDIDTNALKQRWNGFGQHIAYFIHTNTDIVILTIFSNLSEISVYSVYKVVVSGLKSLIYSLSSGINATIGDMIAKKEDMILQRVYDIYELLCYFIVTVVFSVTFFLIFPFIIMYTNGIKDAEYIRPIFGLLMILAEATYCWRFPALSVITSAGHYKQTSKGAYVEAMINIVISLILVKPLGICGVAIGTVCAMLYRTIDVQIYLSKNILNRKFSKFMKRTMCHIGICIVGNIICNICTFFESYTVINWIIQAIIYVGIMICISMSVYLITEYTTLKHLLNTIQNKER